MIADRSRNIGHSVFERLLNLAKAHGTDFNLLLSRYGIERFLYRLSISPHVDHFILKGASLFLVWKGKNYRVTKDADLMGIGSADLGHITKIFQELCEITTDEADGIKFKANTVSAVEIREQQVYEGVRVTLTGMLFQARIRLQVDIGFGDAITPAPEAVEYPVLLDGPAPRLLAYPRYTMIAEKLETMVHLGMANSRMKDFYDVWILSQLFDFDGRILSEAVRNTFKQRSTKLPEGMVLAFTEEFSKDAQKQVQWRAFFRKSNPEMIPESFDTVIGDIAAFLQPILEAMQRGTYSELTWAKGGPWLRTI